MDSGMSNEVTDEIVSNSVAETSTGNKETTNFVLINPALAGAYVIGQSNFEAWSQGFDPNGYLKVLPHPDVVVPFVDPFHDWQTGQPQGNYYSNWGTGSNVLNFALNQANLNQVDIPGFGILKSGDGTIPWLGGEASPFEQLTAYNALIPGPMIIVSPGTKLNINITNNTNEITNIHLHGSHVSPLGNSDNVLVAFNPGQTWTSSYDIPTDESVGNDWYHPHLHGLTTDQVAAGLAGQLIILPPSDTPDLAKNDPLTAPIHTFAFNTFAVQQIPRLFYDGNGNPIVNPTDPLNQTTLPVPAGTPLEVLNHESGQNVYEMSDAPYIGYNGYVSYYSPQTPAGNPPPAFSPNYGSGTFIAPIENQITTVNGEYNPTLKLTTGIWNQFYFANITGGSFQNLQIVKDTATGLIPQEMKVVGTDGTNTGGTTTESVTSYLLGPGQRVSVQELFTGPGKYYLLSNGTQALLGDNVSPLIGSQLGFFDGHLIWGPQVLTTFDVTGSTVTTTPPAPQPFDFQVEQAAQVNETVQNALAGKGITRNRTFNWEAMINPMAAANDADPSSFQGTYTINGEYFSQSFTASMVPLAMPMVGTKEIWNVVNRSGQLDPNAPNDFPLPEWHPFHIHQNDFQVLSINGITNPNIDFSYDTVNLPPSYLPGSVSADNPYGTPAIGFDPSLNIPNAPVAVASTVQILSDFTDYTGTFVDHCHILFHEDAGMMAPVRVILNTDSTWLGLASSSATPKTVNLFNASTLQQLNLNPYGMNYAGSPIEVAIGDINQKPGNTETGTNPNISDNVTDVATIQQSLNFRNPNNAAGYTVKVFDGASLFSAQAAGQTNLDGTDPSLLLKEFHPFQGVTLSSSARTTIATGDIKGDGFSDIVVGISGGGVKPLIEIYSGQNYQLVDRISPFQNDPTFKGPIHIAMGDVNGDNYDDVIVSEGGAGGHGLVEVYDGLSITANGSLDGSATAQNTQMVSFNPYGSFYTGDVQVTSGYILQTPEIPNGAPIQTYHSNITTLATGNTGGQDPLKVFTYTGEAMHMSAMDMNSMDSLLAITPLATDSMTGMTIGTLADNVTLPDSLRLDAAFTPTKPITNLSGTFADLPNQPRGQGAIFTSQQDGAYGLIQLLNGQTDQMGNITLPGNIPSYTAV